MSESTQSLSFCMKEHRLNQADMFRTLYREGLRQKAGGLFVLVLPKKNDSLRLGMVVRKKTAKQAVVRNRIRRVIREWMRVNQHDFSEHWVLVNCQKKYLKTEHDVLRKDLSSAMEKVMIKIADESIVSS